MRLDKFLSEAKVASRKELRNIIRAGRVRVDGKTAAGPQAQVREDQNITLDGTPVRLPGRLVLMLHKPAGFVTSTEDPRDRTVMELLPEKYRALGLRPVGRLDKETEGLLLFTNDGDLSHRLTSPRHQVEKEYYAETEGLWIRRMWRHLRRGSPCGTARCAFRLCWFRRKGAAVWWSGRENTTRSGGCWLPGESR